MQLESYGCDKLNYLCIVYGHLQIAVYYRQNGYGPCGLIYKHYFWSFTAKDVALL